MDIKNFIEGLGEKKEKILKKAALCKSAEGLVALAKENNVDLSEESALEIINFMQLKSGRLSDDDLDSVAGGGEKNGEMVACRKCGTHFTIPWGPGVVTDEERQNVPCPKCHTIYKF